MSVEKAQELLRRTASDDEFRARLEAATQDEKRAILREEGFADVKLSHVSKALPESAGGELSDEEFAAVAGGSGKTTNVTISAAASAGGGAASASIAIAAIAAL